MICIQVLSTQRDLLLREATLVANAAITNHSSIDGPFPVRPSILGPDCQMLEMKIFDLNPDTIEALNAIELVDGIVIRIFELNDADEIPPKSDAHTRAHLWFELGQFAKGIEEMDEAIRNDSQNAILYNDRGFMLAREGRSDEAIRDFNESLRLDPNYALALVNRGNERIKMGNTELGEADVERAETLGYSETE